MFVQVPTVILTFGGLTSQLWLTGIDFSGWWWSLSLYLLQGFSKNIMKLQGNTWICATSWQAQQALCRCCGCKTGNLSCHWILILLLMFHILESQLSTMNQCKMLRFSIRLSSMKIFLLHVSSNTCSLMIQSNKSKSSRFASIFLLPILLCQMYEHLPVYSYFLDKLR